MKRIVPAALCVGLRNNSALGLFVGPDDEAIPYGHNVSVLCTQQARPQR